MSKNFAITGVAGFVAPRHMQAIRDTGNRLIAALDPHDSVGILDRYDANAKYFREYERFDRHLEKLRRKGEEERVHYISICSPNYLHDAHVRTALRLHADAICEKPLVLNPWNLDALEELEAETGQRVYTILQLRVHPSLLALKAKLEQNPPRDKVKIQLTYITSRGSWYLMSWKGDIDQSGGLASNIGVHFYDMLIWLFGDVERNEVHLNQPQKAAGYLELNRAKVQWFLSIDRKDLPAGLPHQQTTYRSITMDGEEMEFSNGFTDLHTKVYERTLAGEGFGISDARPSIQLIHDLRFAEPIGVQPHSHPFVKNM